MPEMRERNLTKIWLSVCRALPETHWCAIEFTKCICKYLYDYVPPKPVYKGSVSWTAWQIYLSKANNWMVQSTTIVHYAEEHHTGNRFDHNPITILSDQEYAERVIDDLYLAENHPEASVRHSKEASFDIIRQLKDRNQLDENWTLVTSTPGDRVYAISPDDIARCMDGNRQDIYDLKRAKKRSRERWRSTNPVPSDSRGSLARGVPETRTGTVRSRKVQAELEFCEESEACEIRTDESEDAPQAAGSRGELRNCDQTSHDGSARCDTMEDGCG